MESDLNECGYTCTSAKESDYTRVVLDGSFWKYNWKNHKYNIYVVFLCKKMSQNLTVVQMCTVCVQIRSVVKSI